MPSFSDNRLRQIQGDDGLASAEDVFLWWLMNLPDGVDAPTAAAGEILRLDLARLRSPRGKRLNELFAAAAKARMPTGKAS